LSKIPERLTLEIIRWMEDKRYGHLQINFMNGKITNINRVESIKVESAGNFIGDVKVSSELSTSP